MLRDVTRLTLEDDIKEEDIIIVEEEDWSPGLFMCWLFFVCVCVQIWKVFFVFIYSPSELSELEINQGPRSWLRLKQS